MALAGFFVIGSVPELVMPPMLPESVRSTVEVFHEVPGDVGAALAETLPPDHDPKG